MPVGGFKSTELMRVVFKSAAICAMPREYPALYCICCRGNRRGAFSFVLVLVAVLTSGFNCHGGRPWL